MSEFNKVLKELRTARGLTQEEFARKLGTSRSRVGMYESGQRNPDPETLEAIADFFNVDIDYLLGRTLKVTRLPQTLGNVIDISDLPAAEQKEARNFVEYLRSRVQEKNKRV